MIDIINTTKTKKRKVSKKTKKSWRKHIDINDVETFLDDKSLEERIVLNDSHFSLDENVTNTAKISKREARLALRNKEPTCFASLKPHTQVPDPISKRNRVRTKEERMSSKFRRKIERTSKRILKCKEKLAKENRTLAKAAAAKRHKRGEIKGDVWQVTTNDLMPEEVTEWMSSDSYRHTIKHLGVNKRKVPSSLSKKPSILPAVEAPHPGTSYNPSYTDHQELLHEIAQKELELIKQEEHLDRVTTQMFKKIPLNKQDEYLMKEMSEGLPIKNKTTVNSKSAKEDQSKEEEKEEEDSSVVKANSKTVKNAKKTLVQKRKQREQKQDVNERTLIKCEKKKLADIYKLKALQKHIEVKEKKQELLRQKRMKKRERESTVPKTLSRIKFEPLDSDFQLTQELTGDLRNCKPSMNLLKDRYKSLQQRNIVAPSVIKLKREKAKMKKFVKPEHKIHLDGVSVSNSSKTRKA